MGSKTPAKAKQENTCDVCDLKFQTIQALRSHQNAKHRSDSSERLKRDSLDSRTKATPKNTPAAAPSRVSKRLQLKDHAFDTESEHSEDQTMEEKPNKTEFSCPKCDKMFPIYFQALKHIQNRHSNRNTGSSESQDIKPVSIETCSNCKKHVGKSHNCTSTTEAVSDQYSNMIYCLGCDEPFRNVALFHKHAANMHRDQLDSFYFKTLEEFNMWKQMVENQIKIKYLALNNSSSQKYYQCNYVSLKNDSNKTYLCPSIIEVKELCKGVQIYYCKEHHGHKTPKYVLPEKFSRNLTNKKEDKSEFDVLVSKDPDENLYLNFKDLMENISIDAKKVSIPHLKKLFKSALEMQGLLNSYDDDHNDKDAALITKSMTDDQITDALEGKRSSARLKRKSETRLSVDAKKKKNDKSDDDMNPKSKNEENVNKTVSKENKEFDSPKLKARASPLLSPSFNDTYKQFIGDPVVETTKKSKTAKPKEIVKTKMGQFSPKKKQPVKETVEKSKPNILKPSKLNSSFGKDINYEVREQENDCNILILKI